MTNADRIRAMSDEELAAILCGDGWNCPPCECKNEDDCLDCWLEWLEQEAQE